MWSSHQLQRPREQRIARYPAPARAGRSCRAHLALTGHCSEAGPHRCVSIQGPAPADSGRPRVRGNREAATAKLSLQPLVSKFSCFARQYIAFSRVAVWGTGAHLRYLDVHLVFDLVVQHLGRRGGSGRHRRRRHRLTQLIRLRAGAAAWGESASQVGSPLLERVGERAQQRTLLAVLALRGRPGSTSPRAIGKQSSKGSAALNSSQYIAGQSYCNDLQNSLHI